MSKLLYKNTLLANQCIFILTVQFWYILEQNNEKFN